MGICEQCNRVPDPRSGFLFKRAAQSRIGDREQGSLSINLPYSRPPERAYISLLCSFLLLETGLWPWISQGRRGQWWLMAGLRVNMEIYEET